MSVAGYARSKTEAIRLLREAGWRVLHLGGLCELSDMGDEGEEWSVSVYPPRGSPSSGSTRPGDAHRTTLPPKPDASRTSTESVRAVGRCRDPSPARQDETSASIVALKYGHPARTVEMIRVRRHDSRGQFLPRSSDVPASPWLGPA